MAKVVTKASLSKSEAMVKLMTDMCQKEAPYVDNIKYRRIDKKYKAINSKWIGVAIYAVVNHISQQVVLVVEVPYDDESNRVLESSGD